MILSITFSLTLLIWIAYIYYTNKKLNAFEIVFVYLGIVILIANLTAIYPIDPKLLEVTSERVRYTSLMLIYDFLIPIIAIWYLEIVGRGKSMNFKILLTVVFVLAFLSIEYMAQQLGIIVIKRWNLLQSIMIWIVFILFTISMKKVVKIMMKRRY